MAKKVLAVLLVGVMVFTGGNVAANDSFPIKEIKVGVQGGKGNEATLASSTESVQFVFFPLTEEESKLLVKVMGGKKEKVLVSYQFGVSSKEKLIYFTEAVSSVRGFSCSICEKLQGKSVVDFFFGKLKYAEAKIVGENVKVTFFTLSGQDSREKNSREVVWAGL